MLLSSNAFRLLSSSKISLSMGLCSLCLLRIATISFLKAREMDASSITNTIDTTGITDFVGNNSSVEKKYLAMKAWTNREIGSIFVMVSLRVWSDGEGPLLSFKRVTLLVQNMINRHTVQRMYRIGNPELNVMQVNTQLRMSPYWLLKSN